MTIKTKIQNFLNFWLSGENLRLKREKVHVTPDCVSRSWNLDLNISKTSGAKVRKGNAPIRSFGWGDYCFNDKRPLQGTDWTCIAQWLYRGWKRIVKRGWWAQIMKRLETLKTKSLSKPGVNNLKRR